MNRTSTFLYFIKTLSNKDNSEVFTLEPLYDTEDDDYDILYEYLDSLKRDVREEIVQNVVKFAKEYREKVTEREIVKMN
ncbi:MAG: hypothetical protein JSV22_10995 [Bacteroidales bacterium]|nr:MAG: hypothetical protein JSV22_10995 [Bacteroidales bacterium]